MIDYFDYRPEYRRHRQAIDDAVHRVLESGHLILGPEVRAFEQECAAYLGTRAAVGVASGTDALALALSALGVGPGDEVLTVANAGVPPVNAIRATGALPRFVDVREDTLLLDPDGLEPARTERTRCVLAVHLYGQPVELDVVTAFAARHGLHLVEDCAQAFGATYRDKPVGAFGEVGCFSFYPTKNLGAFGDGGLCATGAADLEARLRALRMYGFGEADKHAHSEGHNSRLDELQAAILRVKLSYLGETLSQRRTIAERYREGLAGTEHRIVGLTPGGSHTYHLFVIRPPDRRRAIETLRRDGIGHGIHYPEPVHRMEAYAGLGYRDGQLPVSEQASRSVLSLPIYPGLTAEQVDRVIESLRTAG